MPRFSIKYLDPETGERTEIIQNFEATGGVITDCEGKFIRDCGPISAREWAEDYAYAIADKGPYTIEELV